MLAIWASGAIFSTLFLVNSLGFAESWVGTHCSVLVSEVAIEETERTRCRLHDDTPPALPLVYRARIESYVVFEASTLTLLDDPLICLPPTLFAVVP